MTIELKKLIVFGVIITFFTSAYMTFLSTGFHQGFFTSHFLANWLMLIPKSYLYLLPFVLVSGLVTRKLVERLFRKVT